MHYLLEQQQEDITSLWSLDNIISSLRVIQIHCSRNIKLSRFINISAQTSIHFWALVYIGMSNVTYISIRLFKLANTLSGREAIMFEDKSLTRQKLDK